MCNTLGLKLWHDFSERMFIVSLDFPVSSTVRSPLVSISRNTNLKKQDALPDIWVKGSYLCVRHEPWLTLISTEMVTSAVTLFWFPDDTKRRFVQVVFFSLSSCLLVLQSCLYLEVFYRREKGRLFSSKSFISSAFQLTCFDFFYLPLNHSLSWILHQEKMCMSIRFLKRKKSMGGITGKIRRIMYHPWVHYRNFNCNCESTSLTLPSSLLLSFPLKSQVIIISLVVVVSHAPKWLTMSSKSRNQG